LADLENIGDNGSSRVRPPYVVTALAGLRAMCGDAIAVHTASETDLDAVYAAALASDVVIAVVGYTAQDEGEFIPGGGVNLGQDDGAQEQASDSQSQFMNTRDIGGDRRTLTLAAAQVAMIKAAARAGKPVIVVIVAGSAVIVEEWIDDAGAILQSFYAGMEGGAALADLIFGVESPSGRLPFTVARDSADYPFLDIDADAITYGPFAGYTHFDHIGATPRFPFGHGLSYTQFSYGALTVRRDGDQVHLAASVHNVGAHEAEDVALFFVHAPPGDSARPARQLKGFTRIRLAPGARTHAAVTIPLDALRVWRPSTRSWVLAPGVYQFSTPGAAGAAAIEIT
jgi:beta-glucosidase